MLRVVIPALGIVLFGFALYYQYFPGFRSADVVAGWVPLGWLGTGLVSLVAGRRWLPDGLRRSRHIFLEDTILDAVVDDQHVPPLPIGQPHA